MRLCVYCSGGLGRELMDMAIYINKSEKRWEELLFVDDIRKEDKFYGVRVFKFDDLLAHFDKKELEFIIATGEPGDRKKLYQKLIENNCKLGILIHPESFVAETVTLFPGVVVCYQALISSDVVVGYNTIVSNYCLVGHDTMIGNHNFLSTGTFIGGVCRLGSEIYLGPHSMLRDRIKIGDDTIVSMGAAVFQDIECNTVVVGNPARPIKKKNGGKVFDNN